MTLLSLQQDPHKTILVLSINAGAWDSSAQEVSFSSTNDSRMFVSLFFGSQLEGMVCQTSNLALPMVLN